MGVGCGRGGGGGSGGGGGGQSRNPAQPKNSSECVYWGVLADLLTDTHVGDSPRFLPSQTAL